jgi:hypothetical protein
MNQKKKCCPISHKDRMAAKARHIEKQEWKDADGREVEGVPYVAALDVEFIPSVHDRL